MIIAGLATIPQREATLRQVVDSIYWQVDKLYIALNGYDHTPLFLSKYKNCEYELCDNSKGDAMKFAWANIPNAFYVSWDDDLICTQGVIVQLVNKCSIYKAVVGYHGKVFRNYPVLDYHRGFTENYRCLNSVTGDHYVDVIGTGCTCFDTDKVKISIADFGSPNMADLWFSLACTKQNINMIVISHSRYVVQHIYNNETIWRSKKRDGEETRVVNEILSIKNNVNFV